MATDNIRYWVFRIHKVNIPFFRRELSEGRLRIGWGSAGTDLRDPTNASHRHRRMFHEVKKGHILLVPHLPDWHRVAIVEATDDWYEHYRFQVPIEYGDYGHIFPAKLVKSFYRNADAVPGDLLGRSALSNQRSFLNIDRFGANIKTLQRAKQEDLDSGISVEERLNSTVETEFQDHFQHEEFGRSLYNSLKQKFGNKEWEEVLVRALKTQYRAPCQVTQVAGTSEDYHGTDILISLPGVGLGPAHAIAVQVKNYRDTVEEPEVDKAIGQIRKADWWQEEGGYHVIEKVLILTKARRVDNPRLVERGKKENVRLVFADELKTLLTDHAKRTMGLGSAD